VVLINKGKRKLNQHNKGGVFHASPIPLYFCFPLLRPAWLHTPKPIPETPTLSAWATRERERESLSRQGNSGDGRRGTSQTPKEIEIQPRAQASAMEWKGGRPADGNSADGGRWLCRWRGDQQTQKTRGPETTPARIVRAKERVSEPGGRRWWRQPRSGGLVRPSLAVAAHHWGEPRKETGQLQ